MLAQRDRTPRISARSASLLCPVDCRKHLTWPLCVLAQVLWTVIMMFGTVKVKSVARRLVLLTDCDDPGHGDLVARAKAAKKAADLADMDVALAVVPIRGGSGAAVFDYGRFYGDFVDDADRPDR